MKDNIHPKYNTKAKVNCVCGNTFEVGSTIDEINVELCSACHPFYTGKQKLVDTARRVDKFQKRIEAQKEVSLVRKGKKAKKIATLAKKADETDSTPAKSKKDAKTEK